MRRFFYCPKATSCNQFEYIYRPEKEPKMRDIKPLLIILLSIGLVSTWIYHIYDKTQYSQRKTEVLVKDSAAVADAIKDSLNRLYSATISELDTRLDSSESNAASLQSKLDNKLTEINQLKSDIRNILNKRDFSRTDLRQAKAKISELQGKVDELSDQNISMEEEKKQLGLVLAQVTQNVDSLQKNIRRLSLENEVLNEKVNLASVFVASDVRIEAVETRGSSEEATSNARKADKFVASFTVQNRVNQFTNAEVTTVLVQPDGQVLQSTVWDSGTFDAKTGGKKSYTRKIKFDYERGEQKHLLFTIDAEKCQKGTYLLQVWHNGIMIGQASKKLS
jgi:predicted  nucleic acid-binding Zn-ribbon protein